VTNIGANAFSDCGNITSLILNCKSIDNWFSDSRTKVTNISLGDGVETIGTSAFENFSAISSINIPNNVTSIEANAFAGCTGLTSIAIPDSVKSVGASAFKGCEKITSLSLYCKNIGNWFSDINSQITSVTLGNGVEEIADHAFAGFSALPSISLPQRVKSIGSSAFAGCSALTSFCIPNSVTAIGSSAFNGCGNIKDLTVNCKKTGNWFSDIKTQVTKLTLSDNLEEIGDSTFEGFSGISSLTIPKNVKSIGERAFADCNKLNIVTLSSNAVASKTYSSTDNFNVTFGSQVQKYIIDEKVTSIGSNAFYGCSGMNEIVIGKNVTSVGEQAFYGCNNIHTLTLNCKSIGNWFSDCKTKVTKVTLGEEVEEIGNSAFEGFSAITSINLPNSVKSIQAAAFKGCTGLTSIAIPDGVTGFGDEAFSGCTGLSSIDIPAGMTSIGKQAFRECSGLASVVIPSGVMSIGEQAFHLCSNLTAVTLNSNAIASKTYSTSNNIGSIFGPQVKTYVIGGDVTALGGSSFSNCGSLNSITIPGSVKSIGNDAFSDCVNLEIANIEALSAWCNVSLAGITSNPLTFTHRLFVNGEEVKNLVIPESVSAVENYAFAGCTGLTAVAIPSSVTSIGEKAFTGCSSITALNLNCKNIGNWFMDSKAKVKEIALGDQVEEIGGSVFAGYTALTSITIPASVTNIGENAFEGCNRLNSVHITDLDAWCNILFANRASNPLTYAHRVYLNGEEITDLEIPESVSSVGNYAFTGCSNLASASIPNSVREVGGSAFYGCSGIKTLNIGSGMTKIESLAFAELSSLEDIYCYAVRYPVTATDAFKDSYLEYVTLHVPERSVTPYSNHAVWGQAIKIVPIKEEEDEPIYLTLQDAERGLLKLLAQQGKTYTFVVEPQEGWRIHSVCFNDEEVTAQLDENNSYTTPELTTDSRLSVVYEQDAPTQSRSLNASKVTIQATSQGARVKNAAVGETIYVYGEDGVLQKTVCTTGTETDILLERDGLYIIKVEDLVVKLRH